MQASSYGKAQSLGTVPNRLCAVDRSRRTVEAGEIAVTGVLDRTTSESLDLAINHGVMVIKQLTPQTVAQLGRRLG
jgi:hypothetical protein